MPLFLAHAIAPPLLHYPPEYTVLSLHAIARLPLQWREFFFDLIVIINNNKLKHAATYDEDDFGTESESATTKGFGLALTNYHAPGPASNLALKGLGNTPCPARYSFEWG
ncbi:hypothetical protein BU17DRAFT_102757 [Hysterangium stoloniferum]|nr:hypothetical protein BU17DRAFT_102757 [Hysterangium stoloniferum]